MSDQAVYTRLKRVSFVPKAVIEVGAGTPWPILAASSDQIAELFYRVKDAKMSGSLSSVYGGPGPPAISLSFTTADMSADFFSGTSADVVIERSYTDQSLPPLNNVGERSIWTSLHSTPGDAASAIPWSVNHGIICGFSHYAESFVFPATGYYPYGLQGTTEFPAGVNLAFSGEVAFVDNAMNGNPLDPANELWIGCDFAAWTTDGFLAVDVYSIATGNPNEGSTGDLTIELSDSTLTLPLYSGIYAFLASASSSLTITATEWWPYATTLNPFGRVWESETGIKIPNGAGHADAGDPDEALSIHVFF